MQNIEKYMKNMNSYSTSPNVRLCVYLTDTRYTATVEINIYEDHWIPGVTTWGDTVQGAIQKLDEWVTQYNSV